MMAILEGLTENTRIYPLSQVNQPLLNKQTHAEFTEEEGRIIQILKAVGVAWRGSLGLAVIYLILNSLDPPGWC